MRLDKLLMKHGFGSKRDIKRLLFSKQVSVDGHVVMQENLTVDTTIQRVVVNGKILPNNSDVYYMLNKPKNVVTAVKDDKKQTVIDLIDEKDRCDGLHPVGRLDADTTGLVLLTTNGRLGYRLIQEKYDVSKVYAVTVNGFLDESAVEVFEKGVVFHDGTRCKSAKLEILSSSETASYAKVEIHEGKYHQVKKMFLCVGVKVIELQRLTLGPLVLDETLKEGEYRRLKGDELEKLKKYFV
ncbi:16S rRNA pseudouridine(516) synthase [Carnobacteriaceae bacterium zg-C25]|nr:16S rRNA pseudouridine(516) synthase [Carnobacteriaceae bacterium zg-C25]